MKITCRNQLNLVHVMLAAGMCVIWFYFCRKLGLFGDDMAFGKVTLSWDWLMKRYNGWSSRLFIEAVLVSVLYSKWVLQTVTFVVLLATPVGFWLVLRKFDIDIKQSVCLAGLLPLWIMNSAGWGATLINYWYPLTACLFALYFVMKEQLRLWEGMALIVCLLFGTNQELNAIGMLGLLMLMLWRGNRTPQMWGAVAVVMLVLVFELTAPGNHARLLQETRHWLPEFKDYDLIYKGYIGVMRTMAYHLFSVNVCFAFAAAAVVYLKTRSVWKAIAALLVVCLLQCGMHRWLGDRQAIAAFGETFSRKHYLAIFVIAAELGALLWCVVTAAMEIKDKLLVLCVFALALAIPSTMGFSPTVWASSLRTLMPCEFLLVGAAAVVFKTAGISREDFWKVLYFGLVLQLPRLCKFVFTMG